MPHQNNHKPSPVILVLLAIAIITGLFLRIHTITRDELWIDEAYSAITAMRSFSGILQAQKNDTIPPLYYFILHIWLMVLGNSELTIRMFSLCCSLISIPLLFITARKLFPDETALTATVLFAVNPLNIYYAQFARAYTFLQLLIILLIYILIRAFSERKTIHLVYYGIILTGALYTHTIALFLVPLPFLFLIIKPDRAMFKKYALVTAAVLLFYLPWSYILFTQAGNSGVSWIREFYSSWTHTNINLSILYSLEVMGPSDTCFLFLPTLSWYNSARFRIPGSILLYAFFLLGLFLLLRKQSRKGLPVLLPLYLAGFLGLPYIISFIKPVYITARTDIAASFAVAVIAGCGIVHFGNAIKTPWAARTITVLFIILSLLSLQPYYGRGPITKTKDLAGDLADTVTDEALFLFAGSFLSSGMRYYLQTSGKDFTFYTYPSEAGRHLGWFNERSYTNQENLRNDAKQITRNLHRQLNTNAMLFFMYNTKPVNFFMVKEMEAFKKVSNIPLGPSVNLVCYEKP